MPLPPVREAEHWFVEAATAAVRAGEHLDPLAVELVVALVPHAPFVAAAIEQVEPLPDESTLAADAHRVCETLRSGDGRVDPQVARDLVTQLEERMLPAYRPGRGMGALEDDVAVAHAMAAAHRYGGDDTHLMMAEELMRSVVRRYWSELARHPLRVICEAAVVLDALAQQAEQPEYKARALEALDAAARGYKDLGWRAAPFVIALRMIR